jgi:aldehyde dehydrogenase (NAD+)
MHEYFDSGVTRPLAYRRQQLIQLVKMVQENADALEDAMLEDLGKPRQETAVADIGPMTKACLVAVDMLDEWTKPEKPKVRETYREGWDTTIYPTPKGVGLFLT